ncbi:mechanosensitive ion channel protein MscS [Aphanothece hegewaldii CCALA 016]|uniref:Mechanosensitive ion channel protein MscS n=1 Tax=Aphanothece hegewaldii CCALA 016 TaxID=2107694 RepID=A0A2T1LWB1_9CHRO|nr:mechanosensitive ion channel family protein [Aphanothece hegewaldii]PSF36194.1 mechanosensitive ion channel protein MscS [Aphanothece hegewaldii CCALA 016]
MIQNLQINNLITLLLPLSIIVTSLIIGILFKKYFFSRLFKSRTLQGWKIDTILVEPLEKISIFWFLLGGISLSLRLLPFQINIILVAQKLLLATFLGSFTVLVAEVSVTILRVYTTKDDGISPLTTLFDFLLKVIVFSIGFLLILQSVGVSITPFLTAFGVGGVSIGLALQNTLSNLMSGINIITSKKVRPGDYIQLKSGENGYVIDVELKYTIIQEITDNLMVIPNSKIITSSFRNYSLPDKSIIIPIELAVSYDSDLEKVEKVTLQVAQETIQAFKNDDKPFIRYQQFDYFSIKLTVYLKIKEEEFFEHIKLKHDFLKKLHQQYKKQNINIPFPLKLAYFPKTNDYPSLDESESENIENSN